jgi:hypothetical protein
MKTRNPFVRLVTKALVLALLLTGLAVVSTSPSLAGEDPCLACYTNYNICIGGCEAGEPYYSRCLGRCEVLLGKCVGYYC